MVQIQKIFFTPAHLLLSPGELFWVFLSIFLYCFFLCFENHSIVSYHFLTDFLGITHSVTSLKIFFYSSSSSTGSQFEVFWGSLCGMFFYFWELFLILSCDILCERFLFYFNNQSAKQNVAALISVLRAWWRFFGPILSIFFHVLRNEKHSLDIFHECLDIKVVVTKLRNVLGIPQRWGFFWCFWPMLHYALQIVGNHLTFSSEFLRFMVNIYKYICISNITRRNTHTHFHTEIHTHIHTHTHTQIYIYIYYIYTYIYIYIIYIYIYIYMSFYMILRA